MANRDDSRKAKATDFLHHPEFQRGMRDVRLGKRISTRDSMQELYYGQWYEAGRAFAAMNPHIGISEIKVALNKLPIHVVKAWNEYVRTQNAMR